MIYKQYPLEILSRAVDTALLPKFDACFLTQVGQNMVPSRKMKYEKKKTLVGSTT